MKRVISIYRVNLAIVAQCPTIEESNSEHRHTFYETIFVLNAKDGEAALSAAKKAALTATFEHPEFCKEFSPVEARVKDLRSAHMESPPICGAFVIDGSEVAQ